MIDAQTDSLSAHIVRWAFDLLRSFLGEMAQLRISGGSCGETETLRLRLLPLAHTCTPNRSAGPHESRPPRPLAFPTAALTDREAVDSSLGISANGRL